MVSHEMNGMVGVIEGESKGLCDERLPGLGEVGVFAAEGCDVDGDLEQEARFAGVGDGSNSSGNQLMARGFGKFDQTGELVCGIEGDGGIGGRGDVPLGDEAVGGYARRSGDRFSGRTCFRRNAWRGHRGG